MQNEPPAGDSIPGVGYKLGDADCGRGIPQVLDVISKLAEAGIPSVVVGARAVIYYGAKRIPDDWELCVPDRFFEKATAMFTSAPLNEKYYPWPKILPQPGTNIHTYPRFTLKGVNFFFYISPAFEHRIDCDPQKCESSKLGVPYPKLEVFVQSLLETQRWLDLQNVVDGMNLTEEWGHDHLEFSGAGLEDYFREKNKRILESIPEGIPDLITMLPHPDLKAQWQKIVRNKEKRIGFKLPKDKYETRFRIKGSGDPRLRDREV